MLDLAEKQNTKRQIIFMLIWSAQLICECLFSAPDDVNIRWFCCTDQTRGNRATFRDGNFANHNVPFVQEEDSMSYSFSTNFDCLNLFEFNFDKGTAVVEELSDIFRMAR
jgi:hypothetical protein